MAKVTAKPKPMKTFSFQLLGLGLGVEQTPNPDTSINRCAKNNPRYPTPLSAKVLITRITVCYILTVLFSL